MPVVVEVVVEAVVLVVAAAVVVLAVGLATIRRVPSPAQALIVTGRTQRVVTGGGVWAWPRLVRVQRLALDLQSVDLVVDAVSADPVELRVHVDATWQVGPTAADRLAAARSLGARPDVAPRLVGQALAAATRAAVAALAARAVPTSAADLQPRVAELVIPELAPHGLVLRGVHLGPVEDPTGYLHDLARRPLAEAAREARVAEATADRAAFEAEQGATGAKAAARRDAELVRAEADARVDQAAARARHAGLLAASEARLELGARARREEGLHAGLRPGDRPVDPVESDRPPC